MSAQSCDSVPPAPAWTVAIASWPSYGPPSSASRRRAPSDRSSPSTVVASSEARSGSSASLRSSSIAIASSSLRCRSSTRSSSAFSRESSEVIRRPFAGSSHSDGSAACCWRSAACARFVSRSKEPPGRMHTVGDRRQPLRVLAHRHECTDGIARRRKPYRRGPRRTVCWATIWGRPCSTRCCSTPRRPAVARGDRQGAGHLAPDRGARGGRAGRPGPGGDRADDRDGGQDPRHGSTGAIHESRLRRRHLAHAGRVDRLRGPRRRGVGLLPSGGARRRDPRGAPPTCWPRQGPASCG